MTDPLADWWVHQVTVKRRAGSGAYGDVYDAPQTLTGMVDDSTRLVTNAQGEQVASSARVFLPAATADIPLDSQVTLPATFAGRTTRVIAASRHDAGAQPTPNHLEIALL